MPKPNRQPENDSITPDQQADILIAKQKVTDITERGILLGENDIPYAHTSTRGGRYGAFLPRRIKSGSILPGLLILILLLIVVKLLDHFVF